MQIQTKFLSSFPKVSILVLNFNGRRFLSECLTSLADTNYPNCDVYLVDNASTDGSVCYIQEKFPWVKVIRHSSNYGFSRGYNKAIAKVEAKYIMLLNNDTKVLDNDWLRLLVSVMEGDEKVTAVGVKLVFAQYPMIINSVGGKLYRWSGAVDIGSRELDKGQYDRPPIEPFYCCGAAMLIRRDAFLSVGGFDEKMFAYSEDLDLCWRFRLAGFKIAYLPDVKICHDFSASWHVYRDYKFYLSNRNLLRAMFKNYSLFSIFKNVPMFILNFLVRTMMFSLVSKKPLILYYALKAIMWNLGSLSETVKERHKVQVQRKVSEQAILDAMGQERLERVTEVLRKIRFDKKHWGGRA